MTLIEPVYAATDIRTVYIGHIGQMHTVSTCVSSCLNQNSFESQTINSGQKDCSNIVESPVQKTCKIKTDQCKSPNSNNSCKTRKLDRSTYMKQYKQSQENREKIKEYHNKYDAKMSISPAKRAKHNEYTKNYRRNASPEKKPKHNEYKRKYRQMNASSENKSKNREARNKLSVEFAIEKFHEITSQGPLYVCSCCDQLWYKHGVIGFNNNQQSNPEIEKYLLNKIGINNKEWVCTTCHSRLKTKFHHVLLLLA